jgi:hypothetical protein
MTIEITNGMILGAVIAWISPSIGFFIWVKIEVGVIKETIAGHSRERELDDKKSEKKNDEIKYLIRDVSKKLDDTTTLFSNQLYDLNTKITRAETLAEVNNK